MRKSIFKPYILALIAAILLLAICVVGIISKPKAAHAASPTHIAAFSVLCEVETDRSVKITEDISVSFSNKSVYIRDIPVNGREIVKNIRVSEITGGTEKSVYNNVYTSEDDYGNNFISIDVGKDGEIKNGIYTYRISYMYCLPKTRGETDLLAITPIGAGNGYIENAEVTFVLPDGFLNDDKTFISVYDNRTNKTTVTDYAAETLGNGRIKLYANIGKLNKDFSYNEEVYCNLHFGVGVLKTYFDFTPYIFVIISGAIAVFILILKLTKFSKSTLTPVVNFEAPDKMDPLLMGKLIDNRIDQSDVTSLIFYFADKGYLKINTEDTDDPTLIRIVRHLPASAKDYEVTMFEGLFASGEVVKVSKLSGTFYRTVDSVKSMVAAKTKGLYESKSMGISILFAILGSILLGLAPLIISITTISSKLFVFYPFLFLVPQLVIYGLGETIKYYSLKHETRKLAGAAFVIVACALGAVINLLSPSWIMGWLPRLILGAISSLNVCASILLISRTEAYTKQLNEILGFRNFIKLAEKDRLEKLLEDDPQFYYHVLPYAQVLGVSKIWEEKFKDITIQPPKWATSSVASDIIQFHIFNSMLRSMSMSMTKNMMSRPSSSGASGHGRGGFGGFSGGGHGGGGSRFR